MLWSSLALFSLLQLCASKPLEKRWDDLLEKHRWVEVPRGWQLHGPAPADYAMDMRIGLKQGNMEGLIKELLEVSDPAHVRYVAIFAIVADVSDSVQGMALTCLRTK